MLSRVQPYIAELGICVGHPTTGPHNALALVGELTNIALTQGNVPETGDSEWEHHAKRFQPTLSTTVLPSALYLPNSDSAFIIPFRPLSFIRAHRNFINSV